MPNDTDSPLKKDNPGNNEPATPSEAPEFEEDNKQDGEREVKNITRDGKTYEMGSTKAAKLAELINPTNGDEPLSLREAMAEAGYRVPDPGADLGTRISPMDLKPGDLVVGNELQGVYVGDGLVLTSEGVLPLAEVANDLTGDGQGFFRPAENEVDDSAAATGQDASATEDFKDSDESKSSSESGVGGRVPGGLAGMGGAGGRGGGLSDSAGKKASVTPGSDPFDPGGASSKSSDPFSRISVTGSGGMGRSFGTNVHTGD